MLAILYGDEVRFGFSRENNYPPLDRALDAARKAVETDPKDAAGFHSLFLTHFNRNELSAFESAAARALALNPNYPDMLADYGGCKGFSGEYDIAISYLERAVELSPDPPGWYKFNIAVVRYFLKEYDTALATIEGVNLGASFWGNAARAMVHGQIGNSEEASIYMNRVLERVPNFPAIVHSALGIWNLKKDDIEHMVDGWSKAGLNIPS